MIVDSRSELRSLTSAALALAVSTVCLLIFRGPVSIVAALIIPAVIVLFACQNKPLYSGLLSIGLLVVTLLFFQTQLLFVAGYLCLALALNNLLISADMKVRLHPLPVMLYLLVTVIILYGGIRLTEHLFLVPLHQMMLRLSGHNPLRYAAIIFAESLFICAFNVVILKLFISRTAGAR